MHRRLIAFALILAPLFSIASTAEPLPIPGTSVALEPPRGFELSSQFPGVEQADTGSSIMVTEIPGSYDEIAAGFTAENLATRGMELLTIEDIAISGQPALLMSVRQFANGAEFDKWISLFGDDDGTVTVVAAFPRALGDETSDQLRAAVLSPIWSPDDKAGLMDGLSFGIQETDELVVKQRLQNMLLLSSPGKDGPVSSGEPHLTVGSAIGKAAVDDIETFAKMRVAQTALIDQLDNIDGAPMIVDGYPGYEITATAEFAETGLPLGVYQLLVLVDDSYYLAQGLVGQDRFETYLPTFREVA